MKYMRQFGIILLISFIGEVLNYWIPLPVPASIYGLVLMLLALGLHMIRLDQVKAAGKFLIEIMPMMFIPAAVGLMDSWDVLKPICLQVVIITIVSTILVMGISGSVTQWVIRADLKKRKKA